MKRISENIFRICKKKVFFFSVSKYTFYMGVPVIAGKPYPNIRLRRS